MDDIGLKLCDFQANIFEQSKNSFSCSSNFFIRNYMNSSLAARLDTGNFIFEASDIQSCFRELNITKINKGNTELYPSFVLSWIGYLYRYACYEFHLTSKRMYSIIGPKELAALYEAYHSLDTREAINRIFEAKAIDGKNIYYSKKLAERIYLNK